VRSLLFALLLGMGLYSTGAAWGDEGKDAVMDAADVRHLVVDNAEKDAKAALGKGDRHLLAVYGLTLEVPGTSEDVSRLRDHYGLKLLEGTSDGITEQNRQLKLTARRYAAQYNRTIISAAK
jgi:hypothetical protein